MRYALYPFLEEFPMIFANLSSINLYIHAILPVIFYVLYALIFIRFLRGFWFLRVFKAFDFSQHCYNNQFKCFIYCSIIKIHVNAIHAKHQTHEMIKF